MILGVTAVRPSAPQNAIFLSIIVLLSALNGWLVGWLVAHYADIFISPGGMGE